MKVLEECFRGVRGASVESGGDRDLSWGLISNNIRSKASGLGASSSGRILEVGCGEGLLLKQIRKRSKPVAYFAVDVQGWMMKRSREIIDGNSENHFTKCSAQRLPFKRNSFDTVVCINTLHNQGSVADVKAILAEMTRVCSDRGRIVFDIRNSVNPLMYLAYRLVMLYDRTCARLPLKTYSLRQISRFLTDFGFAISKRKAILSPNFVFAPAFVIEASSVRN